MQRRNRKISVLFSSAITAGIASVVGNHAMAQSYTTSNIFTVSAASPYVATDTGSGPGNGSTDTYTGYYNAISSISASSASPNGPYDILTGTLSGTSSYNGSSVTTAFAYNSTGFALIGDYTENVYGQHSASTNGVNTFGQVIGYESRNSAYNTSSSGGTGVLGEEAWLYTPGSGSQYLGLFQANDTYTATVNSSYGLTGTYSVQVPQFINSTGYVAGSTNRYEGDLSTTPATSLGKSSWVEVPSINNSASLTPYEVGLTGTGNSTSYTYSNVGGGTITSPYYSNSITEIGASGAVAGTSTAFSGTVYNSSTSIGTDAWTEVPGASSATRIGAVTFNSSSTIPTYYGTPITVTNTYNGGSNTYTQTIPSPTITMTSGTFAAPFTYGYISATASLGSSYYTQVSRSNTVTAISSTGLVGVNSSYYYNNTSTVAGQDSFIYNPATGTYTQVGLTTSSWNTSGATPGVDSFVNPAGHRSSTVSFINANGQSAGTSALYIPGYTSSSFTQAAWYANASGVPTQIGLYNTADGYHVNSYNGSGSQYSQYEYSDSITNMNDKGMVAGYSYRYNSITGSQNGQDAWVYDPNNISPQTGTNMWIVDPAAEAVSPNSSLEESTAIDYLSPSGVAIGQYITGTSYPYATTAFIWSENNGFSLLNADVTNLSASGYQNIIEAYYSDSPGSTLLVTAGTVPNSNNFSGGALITLTGAIPEPTSMSLVGMAGLSLLRRRRRLAK